MKDYRGVAKIHCTAKACFKKLKSPEAECINCKDCVLKIVDLNDRTIVKKVNKIIKKKPIKKEK